MKILFTLALSIFLSAGLLSQEERSLSPFEHVHVATGIKTTLVSGPEPRLILEVENANYEDVETSVSGGKLTIKFKSGLKKLSKNKKAKVTLFYQDLDMIEVTSGGMIDAENTITSDEIDLHCSSGGMIKLELDGREVDVDLSSGALVTLSGEAKELEVEVSSGALLDAEGLKGMDVEVDVSSAGVVKVFATESLDAEASSAGSVQYKGNPVKVRSQTSSAGSINEM